MTSSPRARFAALLGGAALIALTALPAWAQDAATAPDAKPPAIVNGKPITAEDLAIAEEDLAATLPQMTPEQKKEYLTSFAIDLDLVAAAAEKDKAVDEAEIAKRLDYFRKKILMERYLTKTAAAAVTDEAMKKLYDDTVKSIPPEDEVHARHILVESEDDAKKAYERVKGGEDFAKVAKELSKDPGSSDGGDLGWFTKDRMVKEFAEAAFALKPGEVSQPVKSQFGWHVIKLEERRPKAPPSFDQVKPQISNFLTRKSQQDLVLKLRSEAKIEKAEPPKPATPPAAGDAAPATPAPAPADPAPAAPATPQ